MAGTGREVAPGGPHKVSVRAGRICAGLNGHQDRTQGYDVGEHKKAGMIETSSGVTTEREGWRGGLMNRRLAAAAGNTRCNDMLKGWRGSDVNSIGSELASHG